MKGEATLKSKNQRMTGGREGYEEEKEEYEKGEPCYEPVHHSDK